MIGGIGDYGDGRQVRVPVKIAIFDHHVTEGNRVPRQESPPPVVACQTELTEPGNSFDFAGIGPKAKVTPIYGYGLVRRVSRSAHIAIAASIGAIDPVVQTPQQPIDAKLMV